MTVPALASSIASDEQAKAVTALSGVAGRLFDLVEPLLRPVAVIVGRTTADTIGLLGADWLNVARLERIAELEHRSAERLRSQGVEPEPISPTVAVPLLKAAADEDDADLLDMWEALLAAARDPSRARSARRTYVDLLRRMDPLDALAFRLLVPPGAKAPNPRDYIARAIGTRPDEIEIALLNLQELRCVDFPRTVAGPATAEAFLTAVGRELARVLGLP